MTAMPKPMPSPTPTTQPFWDALSEHTIRIQYSPSTGRYMFYPRVLAPRDPCRRPGVARDQRRGFAVHVHRQLSAGVTALRRRRAADPCGRPVGRGAQVLHRGRERRARRRLGRHAGTARLHRLPGWRSHHVAVRTGGVSYRAAASSTYSVTSQAASVLAMSAALGSSTRSTQRSASTRLRPPATWRVIKRFRRTSDGQSR